MRLGILTFCLVLSCSARASLNSQSWSLSKGRKHSKFVFGKSLKDLEADVFSKKLSFQERWKLVSKVADLKKTQDAENFLMRCLESKEWFLQSAALKVLKKRNPELALYYADQLLKRSGALVVRSEAVEVVSELGGPAHTKILWQALKQQTNFKGTRSLWIRPQIVKTIYKLERSNHSKKEWRFLLRDSDKKIKEMAKRVVERF